MSLPRPTRGEALAATASVLCAVFFLADQPLVALLTALLLAPAVLAYRRRPVPAALGVAAVGMAHDWLVGLSSENPALIAAYFVVLYGLGRYATLGRGGIALGVVLVADVSADPTVPTFVFVCILLGSVWSFGYVVRRRTDDARRAAAVAANLAATDPAVRAAQIVAEERARLAGEALAVVRGAVVTMRRQANDAAADLDARALAAIQHEGQRATGELRRLLGLLRSEPDPEAPGEPATSPRRPWRTDALTGAGLAILGLVEVAVSPWSEFAALPVTLVVLLAATVALRRADPALACVVAVLPPALALALDVAVPLGLWIGVLVALLAWSVATRGRVRGYAALAVFLAVLLLGVNQHDPGNEAMILAIAALAAVAGHLWAARDREQRSAAAVSARLRAQHDALAERAVRAERLRMARELHDVASHAVGVMVLQAGAAAALREQDPDRARDAVAAVQAAGSQALSELQTLLALLDAGAIGAAGLAASDPPADLPDKLGALAERMREAGLHVSLRLAPELPDSPEVAATVYRTVQEALTNAIRYAPGSTVDVAVTQRTGAVEVSVRDDGPHAAEPIPGSGYGLVGLAERVRAHGGQLTAAPHPEGGFAVTARMPATRHLETNP